jgi:hypothetical protein
MLDPSDKNRRVLEAVAKAANWSAPLPKGLYRGVAVADGFGSYTALVAELTLSPAGEVKVKRVVIAIDSGYVAMRPSLMLFSWYSTAPRPFTTLLSACARHVSGLTRRQKGSQRPERGSHVQP